MYITPEEYDIAEINGIHKKTLEYRVRSLGWEVERAISEPTLKYGNLPQLAIENDIGLNNFYGRIRDGWEPERAATQPVKKKVKRVNTNWDSWIVHDDIDLSNPWGEWYA